MSHRGTREMLGEFIGDQTRRTMCDKSLDDGTVVFLGDDGRVSDAVLHQLRHLESMLRDEVAAVSKRVPNAFVLINE